MQELTEIRFYDILSHTGGSIMKSNESSEDYLETILMLSKKLPVVRSVDIATELG